MVSISPVKKAYVPVNNDDANIIIGPNYDEFQSDIEVFNILKNNRFSILSISMPHCDVDDKKNIMEDGCNKALNHGLENFNKLINSGKVRELNNFLWVYEIISAKDSNKRQIGLGGFGKTNQIRTDKNPGGTIIRNEGVNPKKVEGRAKNIKKIEAFTGIVNNALEDKEKKVINALNSYKNSRKPDISAFDENKHIHSLWFITDTKEIEQFITLIKNEEFAFVADGNHRSAAAASLGYENFLTVFFPMAAMGIISYNRLLKPKKNIDIESFKNLLNKNFIVEELKKIPEQMPAKIHDIIIYNKKKAFKITPRFEIIKPENVVQEIDADIVQRFIFDEIFDIKETNDKQINYVGGNKDINYLKDRVDNNEFDYAFILPSVEMTQFADVCKNNLFMPPKSTWFDPKIRIGLVIAKVN